jgi:hypothetical protein
LALGVTHLWQQEEFKIRFTIKAAGAFAQHAKFSSTMQVQVSSIRDHNMVSCLVEIQAFVPATAKTAVTSLTSPKTISCQQTM